MEIERKFLVDLSDLPFDPKDYPARRSSRLIYVLPRSSVSEEIMTIFPYLQIKRMMVREEYNLPLTKEVTITSC